MRGGIDLDGHVTRREDSEIIRMVTELSIERRKGKPKKKRLNAIECDIRTTGVYVNDVEDRVRWRLRWPTPNS